MISTLRTEHVDLRTGDLDFAHRRCRVCAPFRPCAPMISTSLTDDIDDFDLAHRYRVCAPVISTLLTGYFGFVTPT
jgi:hypothetical protein